MVSPSLLKQHFDRDDRRDWLYVLCGPPPMLRAVEATLLNLGIPSSRILSEQFVYD